MSQVSRECSSKSGANNITRVVSTYMLTQAYETQHYGVVFSASAFKIAHLSSRYMCTTLGVDLSTLHALSQLASGFLGLLQRCAALLHVRCVA